MKFRFIGKERTFVLGKWYHPGQIIENDTQPTKLFEEVKEKKIKKGDNNVMES